jgi:hypothetical protein
MLVVSESFQNYQKETVSNQPTESVLVVRVNLLMGDRAVPLRYIDTLE